MKKKIWFDLDNSPHVPLFIPVIKELEQRGEEVVVTARDFAQTAQLLKKTDLSYKLIGKHYGKNKLLKLWGTFVRALQLIKYVRKHKVGAAICHGSRSQVFASWLMSVPNYCGLDYEHTESVIFSKFAAKMWVPERLPQEAIQAIGVKENKVLRYAGYKEEFYLKDFKPDAKFKEKQQIPADKIFVALRPPASQANYHNESSEKILELLVKKLTSQENVFTLCLPRTEDQRQLLKKYNKAGSFKVLDGVVDGLNLAYYADLLISGGGTMNREAALLSTPVYSIFAGELGALDADMEQRGMISFLRTEEDIENKLQVDYKSNVTNKHQINPDLVSFLVDAVLAARK